MGKTTKKINPNKRLRDFSNDNSVEEPNSKKQKTTKDNTSSYNKTLSDIDNNSNSTNLSTDLITKENSNDTNKRNNISIEKPFFQVIPQDIILNKILPFLPAKQIIASQRISKDFKYHINTNESLAKEQWKHIESNTRVDIKVFLEDWDYWEWIGWPLFCNLQEDGIFSSRKRHIDPTINQNTNYHQLMKLGSFIKEIYHRMESKHDKHESLYFLESLFESGGREGPMPFIFKHDTIHKPEHDPKNCESCISEKKLLEGAEDFCDTHQIPQPDEDFSKTKNPSFILKSIKKLFRAIEGNEIEFYGDEYENWWHKKLKEPEPSEYEELDDIGTSKENRNLYKQIKQKMDKFFGKDNVSVVRMANETAETMALYFWCGIFGSYIGGFCFFYSFY